jgi:hypothetical protein
LLTLREEHRLRVFEKWDAEEEYLGLSGRELTGGGQCGINRELHDLYSSDIAQAIR